MPVSVTEKARTDLARLSVSFSTFQPSVTEDTESETLPFSVNLEALERRLKLEGQKAAEEKLSLEPRGGAEGEGGGRCEMEAGKGGGAAAGERWGTFEIFEVEKC